MHGIHEERFSGNCLEARGIPDCGTVLIDYDAEPRILDLVLCDGPAGNICGFMKELVQTGDKPIVRTRYGDAKRDYMFLSPKIMGVAIEVRDEQGNTVWRRPKPTHRDRLRAMSDVELAAWIADHPVRSTFDPNNKLHVGWLNWLRREIDE